MDQKKAIEIVNQYLIYLRKQKFNIQRAYIFGSYAKGNYHPESDIDLAIVLKDVQNNFLMQVQLMKLRRNFDTRIEPHPFDEVDFHPSDPFVNEILKTGIKIC